MDPILAAMSDQLIGAFVIFAICYAAVEDVRAFRIPNWTSAMIALAFLPYAALHRPPVYAPDLDGTSVYIGVHLAIAAVVFLVTVILWRFKLLGGGDVKLLTAIGLWLGPMLIMPFLFITAVASIAIAGPLLLLRSKGALIGFGWIPVPVLRRCVAIAETGKVPYALPIAIAALLTVPLRFM
jgi:prepilin peptidase CpaA